MGHAPRRGRGHIREPGPQPSNAEKEAVGENEVNEGLGERALGPRAAGSAGHTCKDGLHGHVVHAKFPGEKAFNV
eukprot:3064402-Pyramimonas_sp.AAC.1